MPRIYKLSKTPLKLLYKVRHHRGHGIHSPFVFNLINKVIEEKASYYLYGDIEAVIESEYSQKNSLKKYNLLCFRLVNYFGAKQILEIGSGNGVNTLCVTAPASDINCICIEPSPKKKKQAQKLYDKWNRKINLLEQEDLPFFEEKQDCIIIDLNNYNYFPSDIKQYLACHVYEKTFIVIKGIRTNKRNQLLWREAINIDRRTAVLDLFNIGIIFFNPKLYKWSYQISF